MKLSNSGKPKITLKWNIRVKLVTVNSGIFFIKKRIDLNTKTDYTALMDDDE